MEESDASKNRCMLYKVAPNSVRTASGKLQDRYSFIGGGTIGRCSDGKNMNITGMLLIRGTERNRYMMLNAIKQRITKGVVAKYGLTRLFDVFASRECCIGVQLVLYSMKHSIRQRCSSSEMGIVAGKSPNCTLHVVAMYRN
jgi:hypothetical protein